MHRLILLIFFFLFPYLAYATKPCMTSPCTGQDGRFNSKMCFALSDWVAIGRIRGVKHDWAGHPLNKDFASFTLQIEQWQKRTQKLPDKMPFKVGWCHNQQELPADTSGLFIFYGANDLMPGTNSNQYHYFLRFPGDASPNNALQRTPTGAAELNR